MSQTHHSERLRHQCRKCGSSMSYEGKFRRRTNGHHASVFYCPFCDKEVLRG